RFDPLVESGVLRLAVDHERNQILDEITCVEIDRVVALADDLREEAMRESLAPRSVRFAREEAIQIVVVLRIHVDAAFVEPRTVEDRNDDDRPLDGLGRDRSSEANGR